MGNQNQKLLDEKYENAMKNFVFKEQISQPQLGQIKVYTLKNNSIYNIFEIQKFSNTEQEAKQINLHFKNRKAYDNEFLIKILHIQEQNNQTFCQDQKRLQIIGEYYPNTLYNEMKQVYQSKHYPQQKQFPEWRLWLITYQIVNACAYLEINGRFHGELKPKLIYLDSDSNIELIEHNFIPGNLSGYQKVLLLNDFYFLSPEQLLAIRSKNEQPNLDFVKGDVFSLGLTLLELASLSPSEQYYDWTSKQIDILKLNQANNQLIQQGYSTMLTNLIYQMISEVDRRPSFKDLQNLLSNFQSQILQKIDFYTQRTQMLNQSIYTQQVQQPQPFVQTQSVYLGNMHH